MVTRSTATCACASCLYRKHGPKSILVKEKARCGFLPVADTPKVYLLPFTICRLHAWSVMYASDTWWREVDIRVPGKTKSEFKLKRKFQCKVKVLVGALDAS